MKLADDGQEAVAHAEIAIKVPCEEARKACLGAARPRAGQGGRIEQPDLRKWPAYVRPRNHRVWGLMLFGAAASVQPHSRAPLSHPPRAAPLRPATINLRLAAVRRVAYEAADATTLLSPELAASIRRVKGVRRLGVRSGNWLTA